MSESTVAAEGAAHVKEYEIVVNAEAHEVESKDVSYEQVAKIAYPTPPSPDTLFTVSYRDAKHPKDGSLTAGQSVEVKKKGTIFNVKATGRS
jgi:hypothetical protein